MPLRVASDRLAALFSALMLAACASSGASSTAPPPNLFNPTTPPASPPPPVGPTANDFRTSEYNRSWALEAVHAAETYTRGFTGAGVTVGLVDFNFDLSSPEVRYDPASRDSVAANVAIYEAEYGRADTEPHGSAVAAVLAAIKNNSGTHGIAFDATVLAVDFFSGVNMRSFGGSTVTHISDPWTWLTSRGVRIVNASFGYDEEDLTSHQAPDAVGTSAAQQTFAVKERYGIEDQFVAVQRGALLVTSAGNDGDPDPSLSGLDTLQELTFRGLLDGPGGFIIAGASDRNNQLASYSDRAGSARDHYLVAPGDKLVAPWGGSLSILSGTSFAAPMISGAAALIMQRWPSLTPHQVADILFSSATDLGAPGTDSVFGRGLLNLEAAMQPAGTTAFAVAGGTGAPVAQTALLLGPAFGDGGALATNLGSALFFDGFGRDFAADLSQAIGKAPDFSLRAALRQRRDWQDGRMDFGGTSLSLQMQRPDAFISREPTEIAPLPSGSASLHFGASGQEESRAVFRLSGGVEQFHWTAGYGLGLADAMGSPRFAVALTRPFATLEDAPGSFAAVTTALAGGTDLSFGMAESQGESIPASGPLAAQDTGSHSAMLKLGQRGGAIDFGLSLGALFEDQTVLGSHSSGGLALGNGAQTWSVGGSAEAPLAPGWFFRAALLVALTEANPANGSLVALGPVRSSSFGFGLVRENLFRANDLLSLTVSQPLRVEEARVTLSTGAYDPENMSVRMTELSTSLAPTGRELAVEAGYRSMLGAWALDANLAWRGDEAHIAGRNGVSAMLLVSRRF